MDPLPPSQGGFSWEMVIGVITTTLSGWLAKLHLDLQTAKESHVKLREEFATHRSGSITREELRDELRDHKADLTAAVVRLEATVGGQLANLARSVDKLENRINKE